MLRIFATAIIVTVLFNLLSFNSQFGIGFSLFVGFVNLAVYFLRDKDAKNQNLSLSFGILSSLFAVLISFRSNGVVQFIDIVTAVLLLSLNLYFSKSNLSFDYSFLGLIFAPLKSGLKFVEGVIKTFIPETWSQFSTQKHVTSALIRGILIGLPTLIVLFLILSKADPIFENLTFSFLENIWIRLIFSLIVFISSLSVAVMTIAEQKSESEIKEVSAGKEYELLIVLGGLAILFGGFIFIQFKYLFSNLGERELLNLGIKSLTYSEYVRKGFFELLLASVISSAVILYALRYIHKLKNQGKLWVQILTSVVAVEVGLLLLSAAQRVNLYQIEHGLTRARVFGMFFLGWLALLLLILIIKIIKDLSNKTYLILNIVSTLIIISLVNIVNVDGLMATKYKPTVNDEIDYYYLAYLSPDAHLSWLPAIVDAQNVSALLREKPDLNSEDYRILYWNLNAVEGINMQVDYLIDKYGSVGKAKERHRQLKQGMSNEYLKQVYGDGELPKDFYDLRSWQAANLGEYSAYQYIDENSAQFDQLPTLLKSLRDIQNRVKPEIINTTTLDRSINPPLSK